MDEIKLNIMAEGNEITIRQGEALPLKEPEKINFAGTITAIAEYLSKYSSKVSDFTIVKVARDGMAIIYHEDPKDFYGTRIGAHLELSKEFQKFGINTGVSFEPRKLAEFVRMNRAFFEDHSAASELVTTLRNFKVKVDQEIEKADDKRANVTLLRRQAVESNLPKSFKIHVPLFKGMPAEVIEVEVDIDPDTFECQLVSPMAAEMIESTRNRIIDEEISKIIDLTGGKVPIIEV